MSEQPLREVDCPKLDCPNMNCTYEGMDGETYRCEVCKGRIKLDYEDMK